MFPGHPDFFTVGKPEENSFIPLELLIGSKDHRGKEGLCYEISRTPFRGGRKIAVIDDADFLNAEGANSLLKTLEEPPSDSLLILIGTSAGKQLPTIRSRCQLIRFSPLSGKNLARILYENEEVESLEAGMKIAVHAEGNCTTARELMDDSLESFRAALQHDLSRRTHAGTALAAKIVEFVEAVGKETRLRRNRLRIVFSMVLQHDRTALEKLKSEEFEAVKFYVRRIDKTLDALAQIDRNITATLIVEDWAVF